MPYVIKYYRDPETSRRYQKYGGINKPPGLFFSRAYIKREQAQKHADHINSFGPRIPVIVVPLNQCDIAVSPSKLITLNQLHQNTPGVIQEMHDKQEPFILTRHGRLLALVTPLPEGVEGHLAEEYLKDVSQ